MTIVKRKREEFAFEFEVRLSKDCPLLKLVSREEYPWFAEGIIASIECEVVIDDPSAEIDEFRIQIERLDNFASPSQEKELWERLNQHDGVRDAFRNVGRELLCYAIATITEELDDIVSVSLEAGSPGVVKVYESIGFHVIDPPLDPRRIFMIANVDEICQSHKRQHLGSCLMCNKMLPQMIREVGAPMRVFCDRNCLSIYYRLL